MSVRYIFNTIVLLSLSDLDLFMSDFKLIAIFQAIFY